MLDSAKVDSSFNPDGNRRPTRRPVITGRMGQVADRPVDQDQPGSFFNPRN